MAYNPLIPQAADLLSVSQGDLLNNFGSVNTFVNVNHVPFNGPDQGKHALLQMPVQNPAPTVLLGEFGIFNFASTLGTGVNQLTIINSAGVSTPFTARGTTTNGGWFYTPNGLLVKYGFVNNLTQGNNVVAYDTGAAIPAYTTGILYSDCSTQSGVNADVNFFVRLGAPATTLHINLWASQRTTTAPLVGNASASWIVIGV